MKTFGQLKTGVRTVLFPSGEAPNLVAAHDKFFIDAVIDLQQWVDCLQQDNTSVVEQCATFYRCGLTVLDAPVGMIKRVSVIDEHDWCSEIVYDEVDMCHVRRYLREAIHAGGCYPNPFLFFGCPANYPTPTDEGVPAALPDLPLGFHYPQTSTDKHARSERGVWAKERGKIYICPWINSTETVLIKWDGIKRTWIDADLVTEDPLYEAAVLEYVRWQHADKFDKDEGEALRAMWAYAGNPAMGIVGKRPELIRQCREETRIRAACDPSHARGSPSSLTTLYYNTEQSYTASCPESTDGQSATATIAAGTVASTISVADANQRAQNEAQRQAESRLDCQSQADTFTNDAQTATAACQATAGAPVPDGAPVTVTIPAGTITAATKADANAQALALAQAQAAARLEGNCTYWNAAQTQTVTCPSNAAITRSATVPERTFSSTSSQAAADQQAIDKAKNDANAALALVCSDQTYWNTLQRFDITQQCPRNPRCYVTVHVTIPPNKFSGETQEKANKVARDNATLAAITHVQLTCNAGTCQNYNFIYPDTWSDA